MWCCSGGGSAVVLVEEEEEYERGGGEKGDCKVTHNSTHRASAEAPGAKNADRTDDFARSRRLRSASLE